MRMKRSFLRLRARRWALMRRCVAWVVAVVQDSLLDVADNGLHRVVVRAPLGQTRPPQAQLPNQPPGSLCLARVRRVLIQGDPHLLRRIPAPDATQEPADVVSPFAGEERPANPAVVDQVQQEQVEPTTGLLLGLKDQLFRAGVAPPAVGLNRDRLDIEEGEQAAAAPVPPPPLEAAQDRPPLRVGAQEFAAYAAQPEPPFLSTLRRCSRLMAFTRRFRIR